MVVVISVRVDENPRPGVPDLAREIMKSQISPELVSMMYPVSTSLALAVAPPGPAEAGTGEAAEAGFCSSSLGAGLGSAN